MSLKWTLLAAKRPNIKRIMSMTQGRRYQTRHLSIYRYGALFYDEILSDATQKDTKELRAKFTKAGKDHFAKII